jgi:SAM-dependent methyltransferase
MALPEFNESIQKLISMYRNDNNYYDDDYDDNEQLINELECNDDNMDNQRKKLTALGPPTYFGDILEDPEAIWADDDDWLPRDLGTIQENNVNDRIKDALTRIKNQGENIPSYWKQRYETKASQYWHDFYKRNTDRFYKDRHYLHIVFPELAPNITHSSPATGYTTKMLEVGCGVGNAVTPLIEINPSLKVFAMDFAKSAIDTLKKHTYCQGVDPPIVAFQGDIVKDDLLNTIQEESLDVVLCLFVLSAISPSEHAQVVGKLSRLLKPGGKLLIRDYGRFDEAQLRFKKGGKLDDNFYVRCDGTCSYFFELQQLVNICENKNNKLIEEEAKYILRQFANRQKREKRTRVWVHAKFRKL